MTILLKGNFGSGDLGDDLVMLAIYGVLRRMYSPDRIFVQTVGGGYINALVREEVWHGETPPEDVSVVVLASGGLASSDSTTDWMATAQQMVLRHLGVETIETWRRLWGDKQKSDSLKHIAFGVGLGPYVRGSRQELDTAIKLSRYALVVVRDPHSMELCRRWRLPGMLMNATDPVFLTQYWQSFNANPERPPRYVGVVVRDWLFSEGEQDYLEILLGIVQRLRESSVYVRYVSFDPYRDQEVLGRLHGEDVLCWWPDEMDLDDFVWEFAAFDVVLTGRAHGAILAACLGVPPVCMGFDPALKPIAEMLRCPIWDVPYDEAELHLHLGAPQDLSVVEHLRQLAEHAAQTVLDVLR